MALRCSCGIVLILSDVRSTVHLLRMNICARRDSPFSTNFVFMLDISIYQKYVLRIWYRACLDGKVQSLGSIEPKTINSTVAEQSVRPTAPFICGESSRNFSVDPLDYSPGGYFPLTLHSFLRRRSLFPIFTKSTLRRVYFVAYSYFHCHVILVYRSMYDIYRR